jgi:hypothetical protein
MVPNFCGFFRGSKYGKYSVHSSINIRDLSEYDLTKYKEFFYLSRQLSSTFQYKELFILNFITGFKKSEYSRYLAILSILYFKIMVPNFCGFFRGSKYGKYSVHSSINIRDLSEYD